MQYAILGGTGYRVSRLGFGAMRLPMKNERVDRDKAVPMIHRAFEGGVNYIDSAVGYCNQDSQRALGDALKGWRERIVVSTKNPHYNKSDDRPWWENLENSLRRLDVEAVDVYNFHGLNWRGFEEQVAGPGGMLAWMQKAKAQGLIRHICFSFHDSAENLIKLAQTGEFESVTLQYNLLDRSLEKALPTVKKLGMGIVVMGPVGGGRLGSPSEAIGKMLPQAKSVPEIALRFVLANPNVTVALSGMSTMEQVEENVRVAGRATPLSAVEKRRVVATLGRYKKLAELYCTGCNYCMPCPAGVEIPRNFSALNAARVYGLPEHAREQYRRIQGKAASCLACGRCLKKCPQHIDIIAQLRETVRTLDDAYGKLVVTLKPISVERLTRSGCGYNMALACRMESRNLSDNDLRPEIVFAPGNRLGVTEFGRIGRLGPFARRALKLAVEAKGLRDGEPLRLGPSLRDGPELLFAHDPLPVAIGPSVLWAEAPSPAGQRRRAHTTDVGGASVPRVPQVRAEHISGNTQPTRQAKALHSLGARFAWDDAALTVEFDVASAFRRPTTPRRGIRQSDNLWLNLYLDDLLGLKLPKDAHKQFSIALGFPAKGGTMPVALYRPRLAPEQVQTIRAEVPGRGRRRRVLLRIPWRLLQLAPPKAPARLDANFGLTCWPARGRSAWTLSWAPAGRGFLLLAE
ncbi:MAG: hypothetical protein FJ291_25065 [Planctomycetes bacterium]|nr:hypothetical protein [Planctomycetota bacterium]